MTKLRNTTNPLKGAKNDVPPADSHPYMLVVPYGEPTYFRSYPLAIDYITRELKKIRDDFERLLAHDAIDCVDKLIRKAGQLSVEGDRLDGLVDPHTGMWFRSELVLRKDVNGD